MIFEQSKNFIVHLLYNNILIYKLLTTRDIDIKNKIQFQVL
jgi:hypothetical protein